MSEVRAQVGSSQIPRWREAAVARPRLRTRISVRSASAGGRTSDVVPAKYRVDKQLVLGLVPYGAALGLRLPIDPRFFVS